MSVLRQSEVITSGRQLQYFKDEVWPQMTNTKPSQVLFSIDRSCDLIGYGGLVHIDWPNRKAEISFLLSSEAEESDVQKSEAFTAFLTLISGIAFEEMRLNRIFAETYDFRHSHISILEDFGFKFEGALRANALMAGFPIDCAIHGLLPSDIRKRSIA